MNQKFKILMTSAALGAMLTASVCTAEALDDGYYIAEFNTGSSMFHVNEVDEGCGLLTVENGEMTIHISMPSKNIVNLFIGSADEAQASGAVLIDPTLEEVEYPDGTTEEVNAFDVPVPGIGEEFGVAIIGTKGKWYDHVVTVDNPELIDSLDFASDVDSFAEEISEDQAAADEVAALIDEIYVQTRNDQTDEQCAAAKAAWDALTDEQKELVEGENADYDYFGRDTGDASLDDTLNADNIGENEILVVSFGTSFNDSRAADISGIEKAMAAAFPEWSVRRAFTAQIIINHVEARDGAAIDNMDQALERAVNNGVKNLVIQPTHLMHGAEYDELCEAADAYADQFESIQIAEPLLGEVGTDASSVNEDKKAVCEDIMEAALTESGYENAQAAASDGTAYVFLGHGTSHTAKVTYSQMAAQMAELGFENAFIGTVEGEPEGTSCEDVIEAVKEAGYSKVVLRPLMVVAGDHANNDMAGDEDDSWKSMFEASGAFDSIDCQIEGLGRLPAIQDLYLAHTAAVIG